MQNDFNEDPEFQKMRAEIEALMSSDLTATGAGSTQDDSGQIETKTNDNDFGSNPQLRKAIALGSTLLGCCLFFFQPAQSVSGVALLHAMEKDSIGMNEALCNGKPTLVEFYADWCESCKALAPTMRAMEFKYKNEVNFITVNGVNPDNVELVSAFGVDGIPHMAFIDKNTAVLTALIGAVPEKMLSSEINALVKAEPLPYLGYDAFGDGSHQLYSDKTRASCRLTPDA
jgi:thiol-disulfide isomerase/thioredoxin